MFFVRKIMLLVVAFWGISVTAVSQNQSHLLDMRDCDKSCSSKNYTINSVYLSDSTGIPMTNSLLTCTSGVEQTTYVSFVYTTSSTSTVNNGRLFANLIVGESNVYLNYYFGSIPSAKVNSDTLTLTKFPLSWVCGNEVVLQDPLLTWTTNNQDYSNSYICNDYPSGQCQVSQDIVVDSPLAVQFEYDAVCPENGSSSVSFTSTTNGGKEAYQYAWSFTNSTSASAAIADPIIQFNASGTAELTVTDANGTQNTFNMTVEVPVTIDPNENIIHQTDDENPNGAISLDIQESGVFSYAWTGPGDFSSTEQNISELIEGDYYLSVTDSFACTSNFEYNVQYFGALPITWGDLQAQINSDTSAVTIKWATFKARESSHFEVQRAIESISHFETLGKIFSKENSSQLSFYEFKHLLTPGTDQRAYYRICLYNSDGSYEYSETIAIQIPEMADGMGIWKLYPNPSHGKSLYLNYSGPALPPNTNIQIKITAAKKSIVIATEWKDLPLYLDQWEHQLPKGLLIIEISAAGKSQRLKLIYH